jgi:hypothetical protein
MRAQDFVSSFSACSLLSLSANGYTAGSFRRFSMVISALVGSTACNQSRTRCLGTTITAVQFQVRIFYQYRNSGAGQSSGFCVCGTRRNDYLQNRLQWISRPSKRRPYLIDSIGRGDLNARPPAPKVQALSPVDPGTGFEFNEVACDRLRARKSPVVDFVAGGSLSRQRPATGHFNFGCTVSGVAVSKLMPCARMVCCGRYSHWICGSTYS